MLRQETLQDGRIRHFSDSAKMILQKETGILYEDAVDVQPLRYTYEETDTPIPDTGEAATAEDYEAALRRLGVNGNDEE